MRVAGGQIDIVKLTGLFLQLFVANAKKKFHEYLQLFQMFLGNRKAQGYDDVKLKLNKDAQNHCNNL
jgi:hypothetical protein